MEETIREYIESDPDNVFRTTCIRSCPQANFSFIAIQRIEGRSWQEISDNLGGVSIPVLANFYVRCVQRFVPRIEEYLNNYNSGNNNLELNRNQN